MHLMVVQKEVRQVGAAGWHVMVHVELLPSGATSLFS